MKKIFLTTAIITAAVPCALAGKLTMEEHTQQAMLQIQKANDNSQLGGLTIVTVGNDVQCDFRLGGTRIQDAIDSGVAEIRIADDTYNESLVIDDISIRLIGGYDTCTDAQNDVTNGNQVLINGATASTPVITVSGNTQRNEVLIRRLSLQGGDGVGFTPGGGISTLNADLALTIDDSILANNHSFLGGGLAVFSGNTDVTLSSTLLWSNTADEGGGIYCSGTETSVFISDDDDAGSGIVLNTATNGDGGGVLVDVGCTFTSYSGRPENASFGDVRGIGSNEATGHGGGIAATGGSSVFLNGGLGDSFSPFLCFNCIGNNISPVNVNGNTADSDGDEIGFGGGIYAADAGTQVTLLNTRIHNNDAQSGGGIAVENEASLDMRSEYDSFLFFSPPTCWSPGSCSQLFANETATSGFPVRGGGLYATGGADVNIGTTLISGNRADFGTAMYILSAPGDAVVTNLDMEGSLIVNNGDDGADDFTDESTIRINDGFAKLDFNTIADNDLGAGGANIYSTGVINPNNLELFSSIIHNTDGTDVYTGSAFEIADVDCLIVNEIDSLPVESTTILDDPEFIDRANGDYRLNAATSPAIDFCDDAFTTPDFRDSDNEVRGFSDPIATEFIGSYDLGYDETYENDLIFANGFESE